MFCFNRNIETLCFGTEAKQPKQTVSKQTDKNRKKRFVSDSAETSFGSIRLSNRNLFRIKTCFESKLVSNRNLFRIKTCFKSKLVSKDTLAIPASKTRAREKGKWVPISHNVFVARKMVKGDIELREEGKMTLLAGRESIVIVICLVLAAANGLWLMRRVAGRPERKKRKCLN